MHMIFNDGVEISPDTDFEKSFMARALKNPVCDLFFRKDTKEPYISVRPGAEDPYHYRWSEQLSLMLNGHVPMVGETSFDRIEYAIKEFIRLKEEKQEIKSQEIQGSCK